MTEALAKTSPTSLARPDFIPADDNRGTENIKTSDLILPRLSLAQPLSPELEEGGPKYIEGLKKGDAFNGLTKQVYGKNPINVVVVRVEEDRFVEFHPLDQGGGIKDLNVPADDERTKFHTDENGKTIKPLATRFSEFVALRLPEREPISLSFKGAGLKAARTIKSLIALRGKTPSFASIFTLTPTVITNQKGTFSVFNVALSGNVDEETFKEASKLYDAFKAREKEVVAALNKNLEREPGSDDGDPTAPTTEF
jgi:hypothetical protein